MIEMNVIDVKERREVDRDDCGVREDGGGAGGGERGGGGGGRGGCGLPAKK